MAGWEIYLIDRSRLFADGLKMLLAGAELTVSKHYSSVAELELAPRDGRSPDLILVNAGSSLVHGGEEIHAIGELCINFANVPVVLLCDTFSVDQLRLAIRGGAAGYLLKNISAEALKYSLSLAIAGEKVVPSDLVDLVVAQRPSAAPTRGVTSGNLSSRERAILHCIANGSSNKQIATTLGIAEGTVKVHVKAVFAKVGARNRTDAAIWALSHAPGVID